MLKTSTTHYVTLNIFTHFREVAIPTGKKDGDRIEVLCFMRKGDDRLVWIQRSDLLIEEHAIHTQDQTPTH